MAYCTVTDLKLRAPNADLISLTDDTAEKGHIVTEVIDRAIADADSVIDSFLSSVYIVPLSPVPTMIRMISADIVIYNLYIRHELLNDAVAKKFGDSMVLLGQIASGLITIGSALPAAKADSSISATTPADGRAFTDGTLDGFTTGL